MARLLVGKDHQKWLEKIARVRNSFMVSFSAICASLLSVVVVFQENFFSNPLLDDRTFVNDCNYFYHHYLWNLHSESYDSSVQLYAGIYSLNDKLTKQLPYLFAFTVIYDLFSYCFVITVINVMTILKLKQSFESMKALTPTAKSEEQVKAEIRSIMMIVLNSFSLSRSCGNPSSLLYL
jgi:hypothetical protein